MNFIELSKTRQSVRKYSNRAVEKEKIELCLEAARLAPSASNSQPWKFIVLDEPDIKNKIAKKTFDKVFYFNKFSLQAPVIIVLIIEKANFISMIGSKLKNRDFSLIDIGIAAEHFCLQAAELRLGTCMLGWFNEKEIKKILSLHRNKKIALLITLGYPAEDIKIRKKSRKNIDKIRNYNRY